MLSFDEARLKTRSLARNEYLFRQGDKVQAIYFIEDGRLRLDRRTFDGRSLVFGTSSAGEFFVEAALFADIFHCDAVATEPSRVRIYPKAAVSEWKAAQLGACCARLFSYRVRRPASALNKYSKTFQRQLT